MSWGRRPVLMIGLLALPLRGLLYGVSNDPVWLLLALSVFGSLFGFVGMLVAVPVSAVLGVLVRFAVARYRASALFRGSGEGTA